LCINKLTQTNFILQVFCKPAHFFFLGEDLAGILCRLASFLDGLDGALPFSSSSSVIFCFFDGGSAISSPASFSSAASVSSSCFRFFDVLFDSDCSSASLGSSFVSVAGFGGARARLAGFLSCSSVIGRCNLSAISVHSIHFITLSCFNGCDCLVQYVNESNLACRAHVRVGPPSFVFPP
jgi:hypothetical protein